MKKYPKLFRLKLKVNSDKYVYYRVNGQIKDFFRKVDAQVVVRKLRKSMNMINKTLPPNQHKTIKAMVVKRSR